MLPSFGDDFAETLYWQLRARNLALPSRMLDAMSSVIQSSPPASESDVSDLVANLLPGSPPAS